LISDKRSALHFVLSRAEGRCLRRLAQVIMFGEPIFARWRTSRLRQWAVARSPDVLSPAGAGRGGGSIDLARPTVLMWGIAWYDRVFGGGRMVKGQLEEHPVVDRELERLPVVT
jgi:hypothetical protein